MIVITKVFIISQHRIRSPNSITLFMFKFNHTFCSSLYVVIKPIAS